MASSSVSQEDGDRDVDFEISSRRSRIRTARARNINPQSSRVGEIDEGHGNEGYTVTGTGCGLTVLQPGHLDHDASPKLVSRLKEKRIARPTHPNKGKQQRDRRKLREKRRSTGVLQIHSTESTGGSTGEDEELLSLSVETVRNTQINENLDKKFTSSTIPEQRHKKSSFPAIRHKRFSPSDLEADDEDNQDYDSFTLSDSTASLTNVKGAPSLTPLTATRPTNGRPATPTTESLDEQLERAREENRRLLTKIEEKDIRITTLEAHLGKVSFELTQANNDKSTLLQENTDLIRAISTLKC